MKLRFSIRDLLLITVIVALITGWWLDHRKLVSQIVSEINLVEPLQEKFNSAMERNLTNQLTLKEFNEADDTLRKESLNRNNQLNWIRQHDPKLVEEAEKKFPNSY